MSENIIKRWETKDSSYFYFIELSKDLIYVWQTMGAPITEAGGSCTHQSFLDGEYNKIVIEKFGEKVFNEVRDFIRTL